MTFFAVYYSAEKSFSGTPLMIAAQSGCFEIVFILVESGADIHLKDKCDYSCLFLNIHVMLNAGEERRLLI